MLTEIYLVRHAHSECRPDEEETRELSQRGRIDALTVTKLLLQEHIQAVYSSPFLRAIQTVEGTANRLGVSIDVDERFRERNFAEPGYNVGDRMAAMERGFTQPDFAFPGGESNRDVETRGICAINRLLEANRGKRVAIGIHGGIMTVIMHHYNPLIGADFLRQLSKPDIYRLSFRDFEYTGMQKIGAFGLKMTEGMYGDKI